MLAMLSPRFWLYMSVIVALVAGVWVIDHRGYKRGYSKSETVWLAKEVKAKDALALFNENQRHLERELLVTVQKAQNERIAKNQAGQVVRDSVSRELNGVRSDIYSLNSKASKEPASACQIRAITARAVFEQCAQRLADVAAKADGHNADAIMLEQAWPK